MASMLVYVEAERLRALLPAYATGDTWLIGPETFKEPQLERLDEQSWLFIITSIDDATHCVAVLRAPRMQDGALMGGAALVSNRDITHLMPRLGCIDGRVAQWAARPRIVPPSDFDLLSYELGISDDDDDIGKVLADDDRTVELRSAVWDDPLSDDARDVYADYLLDRGDPRGELIALQVGRARSGEPTSDRERQLVRRIAADCAQPLTPYLAPGFELARGFVTRCNVNDAPMPEAIVWHAAWRTVEDLSTTNFALLISPHVRARRVGLSGRQLAQLVDHVRPLPFETIVGIAPVGKSQRGVWIEEREWERISGVGALTNLAVLSVKPEQHGLGPRLIPAILRSPLGARLRQLDAFIELAHADAMRWRDAFDAAKTPQLTLRFIPVSTSRRNWMGPEVLVALRRTTRLPQVIVQVESALDAESVTATMRFIAQLSRNVQYAELHDFSARGVRIEDRHGPLLDRMNAMFPQLIVQPASARSLAP